MPAAVVWQTSSSHSSSGVANNALRFCQPACPPQPPAEHLRSLQLRRAACPDAFRSDQIGPMCLYCSLVVWKIENSMPGLMTKFHDRNCTMPMVALAPANSNTMLLAWTAQDLPSIY